MRSRCVASRARGGTDRYRESNRPRTARRTALAGDVGGGAGYRPPRVAQLTTRRSQKPGAGAEPTHTGGRGLGGGAGGRFPTPTPGPGVTPPSEPVWSDSWTEHLLCTHRKSGQH